MSSPVDSAYFRDLEYFFRIRKEKMEELEGQGLTKTGSISAALRIQEIDQKIMKTKREKFKLIKGGKDG